MLRRQIAELDKINSQISRSGPKQRQLSSSSPSSHKKQQENIDSNNDSNSNEDKIQEMHKHLDKGWYDLYKYLSLITAIGYCLFFIMRVVGYCMSIAYNLGFISNLITPEKSQQMMSDSKSPENKELYIKMQWITAAYALLETAWKVYQSWLIYKAIILKDLAKAEQALKMMRIYVGMIVVDAVIAVLFGQVMNQQDIIGIMILIIGSSIYSIVWFGLIHYYGASKVHELLSQAHELIAAENN